jgi:hypothetical protein
VICLGDCVDVGFHPQGVLTPSEMIELEQGEDGRPMSLYKLESSKFSKERFSPIPISLMNLTSEHLSLQERATLLKVVKVVVPSSTSTEWVLRNLTRRQYVRESPLRAEGMPRKWDGKPLGLEDILLTQVCWSSDSSASMPEYNGDLTLGPWAGDRVDIKKVDILSLGKGWRDVTNELVGRLAKIWNSAGPC